MNRKRQIEGAQWPKIPLRHEVTNIMNSMRPEEGRRFKNYVMGEWVPPEDIEAKK